MACSISLGYDPKLITGTFENSRPTLENHIFAYFVGLNEQIMSDQDKINILKMISSKATIDEPTNFSFNAIAKATNLSREELDKLMIELDKDRFITEFPLEGNDNLRIILHQKGHDAAHQ